MDRLQNEDRLSAYFDGELPASERSEIEARLRDSLELRRTLADFQAQRQGFAALAAPALPLNFSDRIMERVLAAATGPAVSVNTVPANAPVAPPPFPVKATRRFTPAYLAGALSVAAMIALAAFLTRSFWSGPTGESQPLVQIDGPATAIGSESNSASDKPNEAVIASSENKAATGESNESNAIVGANPTERQPELNNGANIASNTEKPIEPVANSQSNRAIADANAAKRDSSSRLIDSAPKSAVYAAATSKARPRAFRVQIGTRSEFDVRLKEIGVSIYHGKLIDPPTSVPRAQPVELMPDPEYVIVEGSEAQLAELIEKLGAQADLMLHEPKSDLEAEMLIEALCKMDLAAKPLRPAEAKEGEVAAFTIPAKAIMTLLPLNVPTGEKPGILTDASKPNSEPNLTPRIPPKTSSGDESSLYVPRLIFILDVRMGEAEGASKK